MRPGAEPGKEETGGSWAFPGEIGRVDVASAGGGYPVLVGPGLLDSLPEVVKEYAGGRRLALVTDSNVGPLHGGRTEDLLRTAGLPVTRFTFPAGEASKTRKTWSIVTDEMLEAGFGRDSCVLSLGGGVTTDLAGFVAATYLRGIPVLQIPTSYLAMIDASVGGKTGVDVRLGKNLVGAFHPPVAVVGDPDLLATLPREERGQGLVEAVKHGAILDEEHFQAVTLAADRLLEADPRVAAEIVLHSVRLKAQVVGQDEFEGGYRQILNFGHTVGHALEAASDYALGHGSAVALGMLAEAWLGEEVGVTAAGTRTRLLQGIRCLLGELPTPGDPRRALTFFGADKKSRGGRPRFVLLERIGETCADGGWSRELPPDLIEASLRAGLTEESRGGS